MATEMERSFHEELDLRLGQWFLSELATIFIDPMAPRVRPRQTQVNSVMVPELTHAYLLAVMYMIRAGMHGRRVYTIYTTHSPSGFNVYWVYEDRDVHFPRHLIPV